MRSSDNRRDIYRVPSAAGRGAICAAEAGALQRVKLGLPSPAYLPEFCDSALPGAKINRRIRKRGHLRAAHLQPERHTIPDALGARHVAGLVFLGHHDRLAFAIAPRQQRQRNEHHLHAHSFCAVAHPARASDAWPSV